jgi:hypothetical protein
MSIPNIRDAETGRAILELSDLDTLYSDFPVRPRLFSKIDDSILSLSDLLFLCISMFGRGRSHVDRQTDDPFLKVENDLHFVNTIANVVVVGPTSSPSLHPGDACACRGLSFMSFHLCGCAHRRRSRVVLVLSPALGSPSSSKSTTKDSGAIRCQEEYIGGELFWIG